MESPPQRRLVRVPRPGFLLHRHSLRRVFAPESREVSDAVNGAIRDRGPLVPFDSITGSVNSEGQETSPHSTQATIGDLDATSTQASTERNTFIRFLHCITTILSAATALPASHLFFSAFHYAPDNDDEGSANDITSTPTFRFTSQQFKTKIDEMVKTWEIIKLASLFLIGAVPVILQIQPIYTNVITRVSIVASGLLACASLVSSYLYVHYKDRFTVQRSMDSKWRGASTPGEKFWRLVSLPLAFVLWSLFFLLVTICYFIWGLAFAVDQMPTSSEVQYANMFIGALFVTSLPVISFTKIYYACKEIKGNGTD